MSLFKRIISLSPLMAMLAYFLFALIYIHPGEIYLFEKSTTQVLSDGTDPATFPYQFGFLIDQFKNNTSNLFYGAVFNANLDYPHGQPMWIPMIERIQVLFLSLFLPVEQISTGLVLLSMTLNGLFMFLLGRAFQISNVTSFGMGLAWAFSAYTRARAKVHMGLVGIYHLPLMFLCLLLLKKDDKKSFILSSLGFLIISFMPHYYVVTLAFFTPLIFVFIWLQKLDRNYFFRICLAALPAIFWLCWSLLKPLPSSVQFNGAVFPTTGQTTEAYHPYLNHFKAELLDYFTGDIGLGPEDINPIKMSLQNNLAANNFNGSNPHEKAQGIRWIIWIFAITGIIVLFRKEKIILFFIIFGFISCWLSLSPEYGASLWLHKLVNQIRVPNRAGIGLAFSLIMIAGIFVHHLANKLDPKQFNTKLIPWAFVAIIIFELPPLINFMPIANILPKFDVLTNKKDCGVGITYPVIQNEQSNIIYYYLLQRLRGSNCKILSSKEVTGSTTSVAPSNETIKAQLEKLHIDWVILDRGQKCGQLNLRSLTQDEVICEF